MKSSPAPEMSCSPAALAGPKELLMVNGAGHNQSLRSASTWNRIDAWIERVLMKK